MGSIGGGLMLRLEGGEGLVKGGGGYMPCFQHFDVCSMCMGVGMVG